MERPEYFEASSIDKSSKSIFFAESISLYLVKYLKLSQYKTFLTEKIKNYSYPIIENYADHKYEVNSKEELVPILKTIADDIKKPDFAGYTDAVEC